MTSSKPVLSLEIGLLALLALLWGSSYLFIKIAVTEIPPVTLVAMRVGVAALFLTAIVFRRGERFPRDGATWSRLLIHSFFNSLGAWTVLAWGQQYVDSGLASVLNSTSPVFVFLITACFTRHEATGWIRFAGACLGLFGVLLIVGPEALAGIGQHAMGQLAVLSGAILYAGAAIHGRRFAALPATVTAAATMILASVFLAPASLFLDHPWTLSTPSVRTSLPYVPYRFSVRPWRCCSISAWCAPSVPWGLPAKATYGPESASSSASFFLARQSRFRFSRASFAPLAAWPRSISSDRARLIRTGTDTRPSKNDRHRQHGKEPGSGRIKPVGPGRRRSFMDHPFA